MQRWSLASVVTTAALIGSLPADAASAQSLPPATTQSTLVFVPTLYTILEEDLPALRRRGARQPKLTDGEAPA